jgi:sensor histidine kinase regulating citrate/malate metabolism
VSAAGAVGQSLRHLIFLLRPIVDFCGLAVAYAYQSRISEYMAAKERDAMQMVLRSQYDQYRYYQNTMEMVHIKYHDLKHQITGLRAETDNEKRKEWLDRLEEELEENHLVDHTGNQVLDTILGAKVFQAQRIHARLTCVADGKLLGFMHVTDICTIFGNALDNALEAVAMIEDQEKRMIQVFLTRQKQFISIVVSNYCGEHGPKQSEQGTYLTTKSDKKNHGYGLKSIRYTVEKYEGSMTIRQPNDWFELHVLIPIPNA